MMRLPIKFKNLFRSKKQNESGQILIVFLLILVVGLAIALSIASRTITDIRQTTTSDDSNKAYFAAEAGIETALKKIEGGTISAGGSININFSTSSNSTSKATVNDLIPNPISNIYQVPDKQLKDDVSQISLVNNFNATNPVTPPSNIWFTATDGLNIYWGGTAGTPTDPYPAIEVSVIGVDASGIGSWTMAKYAFDPAAVSHGNGFCTQASGSYSLTSELSSTLVTYQYKATINNFNVPPGTCNNDIFPLGYTPVLARIRMLYNTTAVPVAIVGCTSGGCAGGDPPTSNVRALKTQGQVITSVGVATSGVQRKLLVYRTFPSLPPIFDYVLFNGSTLSPLAK